MLRAALAAAVHVSPLAPGLTEDELRTAIQRAMPSLGAGAIQDAFDQLGDQRRDAERRLIADRDTLDGLVYPNVSVPDELRPTKAFAALRQVFEEFANEHGVKAAAPLSVLRARAHPTPIEEVDRAIGFLTTTAHLRRSENDFQRVQDWEALTQKAPPHQAVQDIYGRKVPLIIQMIPFVRDIVAARTGASGPSIPPVERFEGFLREHGWQPFAVWWSEVAREAAAMRSESSLGTPTAACVLYGALLEAALTAICPIARDAKEWRQDVVKKPSTKWTLWELINQAREAKTFTPAEAAHAETIAEMRNRIHAGRYASGAGFAPPYANAHEARLAREHLDLLLNALLTWVAALQAKTKVATAPTT
jgi:hypothetical protein